MTSDSIAPDPSKTDAIRSFHQPQNVSEVRRFLGMASQLGRCFLQVSTLSQTPMGTPFQRPSLDMGTSSTDCLYRFKSALCQDTCLLLYDPLRETKLSGDASSYGLGAVLYKRTSPDQLLTCFYHAVSILLAVNRLALATRGR